MTPQGQGQSCQFRDHLQALGYDVTYEEGPGVHDWYLWDEYILKVLNWLPLDQLASLIQLKGYTA